MLTDQDIVDRTHPRDRRPDAIRPRTMPLTVALGRLRFLRARLEPVKAGVIVDVEGFVDLRDMTRKMNSDGAISP
jgi:hypothetical protein